MPWRTRLRWDADTADHNGRTYALWKHPGLDEGRGRYPALTWHLHEVLATGHWNPEPISGSLGHHKRRAHKLAELMIVDGWRCSDSRHADGEQRWCGPSGDERPLSELLEGAHLVQAAA